LGGLPLSIIQGQNKEIEMMKQMLK
jgi:uncharacterized protein (DUF305 family)